MDERISCKHCSEPSEFFYRYENGWFCEEHKRLGHNFNFERSKSDKPKTYRIGISIRRQIKELETKSAETALHEPLLLREATK